MNLMSDIALGLIAIGLFVFCDYSSIRWWEQTGKDGYITWWLLAIAVAGPLGLGIFGMLGSGMGAAAVSTFVNTGTAAGLVLVGLLLRGERLTSYQMIGVGCGLVAICLINMGKHDPVATVP